MKKLGRFGCIISALALCTFSTGIKADADAYDSGTWSIKTYYQVNSWGVEGYSYMYVKFDSEKIVQHYFNKGDIVYASFGYNSMGLNWAYCYSDESASFGSSGDYGYVDMQFLSEVGSVYDEPEPEPEPVVTEPPTEATKKVRKTTAATTVASTTTKPTTTTLTTTVTTITTATNTTDNAISVVKNNNDSKNDFLSNNLVSFIMGGVVVMIVGSATIRHKHLKIKISS